MVHKRSMIDDDVSARYDSARSGTSRRGFLKIATGILSAAIALVVGVPSVIALIASTYRKSRSPFIRVGEVTQLPKDQPVSVEFQFQGTDAFIRETVTHDAWVIRRSDTELTVFSPICTHLGCHYDWDASARQFICPCHNSRFSITGQVLSGPAPRPLDTLPYKVEDGALYVKWERFEAGLSSKIPV